MNLDLVKKDLMVVLVLASILYGLAWAISRVVIYYDLKERVYLEKGWVYLPEGWHKSDCI